MRVWLFVSCVMVQAMPCGPYSWRLLHAARAQYGQRALHPPRAGEAAVRQKPMVPDIHSEPAEDVVPEHGEHDPGPTEEPGKARKERDKMDENNWRGVSPLDGPRTGRCRCRQMTTTASQRVVVHEPSESPAPSPHIVEAQHLFAVTHFLGHGLGQVALSTRFVASTACAFRHFRVVLGDWTTNPATTTSNQKTSPPPAPRADATRPNANGGSPGLPHQQCERRHARSRLTFGEVAAKLARAQKSSLGGSDDP
jgi:hypothetical protein